MGIYSGLQKFIESGGQYRLFFYELFKKPNLFMGQVTRDDISGRLIITIDEKLSLEKQTITLIHELLHVSDEHMPEEEVEKLTHIVYRDQPVLVKHLRNEMIRNHNFQEKFELAQRLGRRHQDLKLYDVNAGCEDWRPNKSKDSQLWLPFMSE